MGTPLLHEGTTSNRYTIIGRLAGGGMADIFIAKVSTEGGVERHVVLKRVLDTRSRDPAFARMFLDEARLAAQLQHPNIAQVHDVGKLGGSYFFTMEYVHGEDVRALMYRLATVRRPLPVHHALHIASGALSALHHAHERKGADGVGLGVVHRDVSPSNVMVAYDGTVKLLDFGVAKAAQRTQESQAGTIKGKIAYLSPEQCEGKEVDRRSDIFSLGIVLFELLTGRRLYRRESDFKTMSAIVQEPPPSPTSRRPEVSDALSEIVLKALAKDPDKRYATAADMLEAVENIAATERHVMSGAAMGRFMRELCGERKEPWIEMPVREHDESLTVTGKSLTTGDVLPTQSRLEPPDAAFAAQLASAPEIGRPALPEPSPISGATPVAGVPVRETPPGTFNAVPDPRLAPSAAAADGAFTSSSVEAPTKVEGGDSIFAAATTVGDGAFTPSSVEPPTKASGAFTASSVEPPTKVDTPPKSPLSPLQKAAQAPAKVSSLTQGWDVPDLPEDVKEVVAPKSQAAAKLEPPANMPKISPRVDTVPAEAAAKLEAARSRPIGPGGVPAKLVARIPTIAPKTEPEALPFGTASGGTAPLPTIAERPPAPAPAAAPETPAVIAPSESPVERASLRRLATEVGTGGAPRTPGRRRAATDDADTIPPPNDTVAELEAIKEEHRRDSAAAKGGEAGEEGDGDGKRDRNATAADPDAALDAALSSAIGAGDDDDDRPTAANPDAALDAALASAIGAGDHDNDQRSTAADSDAALKAALASGLGSRDDEAEDFKTTLVRADSQPPARVATDGEEYDVVAAARAQAKRRQLVFLGGALAVSMMIVVGIFVGRGTRSRRSKPVTHAAVHDASAGAVTADAAGALTAIADAGVEIVADATVEQVASVGDAAVEQVADAAVADAPPDPTAAKLSIAESAVAGDWSTVLAVCLATADGLSAAENASCAIAACHLKKRAEAVEYAKRVRKAEQGPIQRACKANKISLAAPKGRPKQQPSGPTIDPCEANPLKCQK